MSGAALEGDLDEWIATLDRVPRKAPKETKKVVGQGLNNVKKDWRARWANVGSHIPYRDLPLAISYDVDESGEAEVEGVVGPQSPHEQWELGSFIEFGVASSHNHSGPHPGALPAAEAEEPRFAEAMVALGEDLLMDRKGVR
jgi:hypothetical protein